MSSRIEIDESGIEIENIKFNVKEASKPKRNRVLPLGFPNFKKNLSKRFIAKTWTTYEIMSIEILEFPIRKIKSKHK